MIKRRWNPYSIIAFRNIALTLFAFMVVLCEVANAGNSLPPQQAAFGGTFEKSDFPGPSNCVNPNGHTFACTCPGGIAPKFSLRVINDNGGAGTKGGGNYNFCSTGAPTSTSEFNGAYQIDDNVPGGSGCRTANANTGACSCPAGTYAEHLQTIVDAGGGSFIGSHIYVCMKPSTTWASFGGVYQKDDNGSCRTENQYTGACSCPASTSAVTTRVLVANGSTVGGSTIYTCYPPTQLIQICPGQFADPTGRNDASPAIASCFNQTASGGTLEIPAGTYLMQSQLVVNKPITIKTLSVAPTDEACGKSTPCATLVASATFSAEHGIIYAPNPVSNVTLDHIILDGNRFTRLGTPSASECTANRNWFGYNANFQNCTNCKLNKSTFTRALCGSGFSFAGDGATITNNTFSENGDHNGNSLHADGLTYSTTTGVPANPSTFPGTVITGNLFDNNSDIGLLLASGYKATVTGNTITQTWMTTFAGFMLDNLNGTRPGVFTSANISGNTINCAPYKCFYGAQLGPHPWYPSANIIGGSFTNNSITGGFFSINLSGAGTASQPITVSNNTVIRNATLTSYTCGAPSIILSPSGVNASPDSYRVGPADTSQTVHNPCYGP